MSAFPQIHDESFVLESPDEEAGPSEQTSGLAEDTRELALEYARRGFAVFPVHSVQSSGECTCGNPGCHSPGKHPRTRSGVKAATTDVRKIAKWKWADSNIGIATGSSSSIVVLDIDGPEGTDSLGRLESEINEPLRTLTVTTGRGRHLYFSWVGAPVKNSAGSVAKGIDVRGDGGYVIAPGSIHHTGTRYEWLDTGAVMAPLPDRLAQRLACPQATNGEPISYDTELTVRLDEIAVVPEGQRNATLFKLACSLRARGTGLEQIEQALFVFNQKKCVPPLPQEELSEITAQAAKYPVDAPQKSSKRAANSPLYWFPVNVNQWLGNPIIATMTDSQLGRYFRLVLYAWQQGAMLEDNPEQLWRLAGAPSRRKFEQDAETVLAQFDRVLVDGKRMLVHGTMAALYADKLELFMKKKAARQGKRTGDDLVAALAVG